MKEVAVVGDVDFCLGFKLIGIKRVEICKSQQEFEEKITPLLENKEIGIVFIQQEKIEASSWKIKKYIESKTYPVVVSFSLKGKEKDEDINEIIKKALGFEIK